LSSNFAGYDKNLQVNTTGDGKNVSGFVVNDSTAQDFCQDREKQALACAAYHYHGEVNPFSTHTFTEVHIAFNGGVGSAHHFAWNTALDPSLDSCTSKFRYDVWVVAVHELGHGAIGLDHVDDPHSVMYPEASQFTCDLTGRLLALGDVRGLRRNYGG
jgi:hypothetical protein